VSSSNFSTTMWRSVAVGQKFFDPIATGVQPSDDVHPRHEKSFETFPMPGPTFKVVNNFLQTELTQRGQGHPKNFYGRRSTDELWLRGGLVKKFFQKKFDTDHPITRRRPKKSATPQQWCSRWGWGGSMMTTWGRIPIQPGGQIFFTQIFLSDWIGSGSRLKNFLDADRVSPVDATWPPGVSCIGDRGRHDFSTSDPLTRSNTVSVKIFVPSDPTTYTYSLSPKEK